jgi:hypothetical protein
LSRQYWPYAKWFGSAFAKLDVGGDLSEVFARVVSAADHAEREQSLVQAYERVAERHNAARLTAPADPAPREFFGRGFRVLMADRFVDACLAEVSDEWLRAQPLVGSVDQFVDSTDALHTANARRLRSMYESRGRADRAIGR